MDNSTAARFARLFAGRTDAYGTFVASQNRSETIRAEVTLDTYADHLKGKRSLGIAPLRDDGTVRFLAFDIDHDDIGLARSIRAALADYGLQGWIERTKSKGYHVWTFFAEDTSAAAARKMAKAILRQTGAKPSMELFPKQDSLVHLQEEGKPPAIGNWINLPYFGGLEDKRVFIEDSGAVIPLPEFLNRVQTGKLPENESRASTSTAPSRTSQFTIGWGDRSDYYDGPPPTCVLGAMESDADTGERHETGIRLVGYWRNYAGLSDDEVWEILEQWNNNLSQPLSQRALRDCFNRNSHYSWGCSRIREIPAFRDACSRDACGLYNPATFGEDDELPVIQPSASHEEPEEEAEPEPQLSVKPEVDERDMVKMLAHGWLKEYIEWASSNTSAPMIFHLATGLATLSAAIGHRVGIQSYSAYTMYPNLYIVAVAASGFMHKSTATSYGRKLIETAIPGVKMPDSTSPESFFTQLSDRADRILFIDEFGVALGEWNKRTYQSGMKGHLTTLFDNLPLDRFLRGTKGSGETEQVHDVALTLLATTTPDWLQREMKLEDLRAGFTARILWMWAEHKGPEPQSRPFDMADKVKSLGGYLQELESMPQASADFSAVDPYLKKWQQEFNDAYAQDVVSSPEVSGVLSRANAFVHKLAVVLAVSEGRPTNGMLFIRRHHVERAIAFVEWSIERQRWLVNNVFQFSDYDISRGAVINKIRGEGGRCRYSDIVKAMRREKKKVDELLGTMVAAGEIRKVKPVSNKPGRPTIFVCFPDRVLAGEVDVA